MDASTGIEEMYVELWHFKSTDEWSWNDDQNSPHLDPANVYMPGNMGYVCEYE